MSPSPSRAHYDVVVVGARCAGAATAMLLARGGLSVLCIDRGRYGSDTLSTHALMRGAVLLLQRWGVLEALRAAGTPRVARTSFHYGDEVVDVDIRPRDGVDGLYAPRRTVIDRVLVDAAKDAGVEIAFAARLLDLRRDPTGRVNGVIVEFAGNSAREIGCKLVIGADGVRSTVASIVGAHTYLEAEHTTAVIYNYWEGVGLDGYHWYYRPLADAPAVSAGAIATNGGMCVFAAVEPGRFHQQLRLDLAAGYHRVLGECDSELAKAVAKAERRDRYRAFAGLLGYMRHSFGPGWALVGDAGYFKDPITAHGMTDALIDADKLAAAVLTGEDAALADYQAARDSRGRPLFEVTDAVAALTWELPRLRELHVALSDTMKKETATLTDKEPT